jgi:hypothetical protein
LETHGGGATKKEVNEKLTLEGSSGVGSSSPYIKSKNSFKKKVGLVILILGEYVKKNEVANHAKQFWWGCSMVDGRGRPC